jgi:hypothetical protein
MLEEEVQFAMAKLPLMVKILSLVNVHVRLLLYTPQLPDAIIVCAFALNPAQQNTIATLIDFIIFFIFFISYV